MLSTSITDGVVILRPFQMEDALQLHEAVCELLTELKPWMSWAHDEYSIDEVHGFIKMHRAGWEGKNAIWFCDH